MKKALTDIDGALIAQRVQAPSKTPLYGCVCLLTSKLPHQSWYKIEVKPIPYVNRKVEKNNSKKHRTG